MAGHYKVIEPLFVNSDHNVGCFYNGISIGADLQIQFVYSGAGDRCSDDIAAANVDGDNGVDGSFVDIDNFSF